MKKMKTERRKRKKSPNDSVNSKDILSIKSKFGGIWGIPQM